MRISYDDRALSDIAKIYRWIAYERPAIAGKVVWRLYASIERLTDFPDIGRPGKDPGTREWIVPKTPYLVVYEVFESSDELRVLAIFHQAQDRQSSK